MVERPNRGVEAQCLCQRPPPALSQVIEANVERCERGVHATLSAPTLPCPSSLKQRMSDETVVLRRSVSASARPPPQQPLPGDCSQC